MDTKIVSLIIGRGGSSLKDKNILPVLGHPLLHWTAAAARRSKRIGRFYISSDDDRILATGAAAGYAEIRRPAELSTETAQSCDAVRHALTIIEADGDADIVVVQHANVGTISEILIDDCIEQLLLDPSLSSVVPSHTHNEYHPMRAKGVTEEGLLKPFVETTQPVSANRQELPTCYFFDHSIWALRADAIRRTDGQGPWDCMGRRIKPFPTAGTLDVHSMEDIVTTEKWIVENNIPHPDFSSLG